MLLRVICTFQFRRQLIQIQCGRAGLHVVRGICIFTRLYQMKKILEYWKTSYYTLVGQDAEKIQD
jgi:hypothetical protein